MPVALYTGILPSDWGLGMAKWYSRRFGKTSVYQPRVDALRNASRQLLVENDADVVVMGHSHQPELTLCLEGVYINTGSWYLDKTVKSFHFIQTTLDGPCRSHRAINEQGQVIDSVKEDASCRKDASQTGSGH